MRVKTGTGAVADLAAARRWYREHAGKAIEGRSFADYRARRRRISDYPELGEAHPNSTRRLLLQGFPFAIVYRLESDAIVIVAVVDLRREPGYWLPR